MFVFRRIGVRRSFSSVALCFLWARKQRPHPVSNIGSAKAQVLWAWIAGAMWSYVTESHTVRQMLMLLPLLLFLVIGLLLVLLHLLSLLLFYPNLSNQGDTSTLLGHCLRPSPRTRVPCRRHSQSCSDRLSLMGGFKRGTLTPSTWGCLTLRPLINGYECCLGPGLFRQFADANVVYM